MEEKLLSGLTDIGYSGALLDKKCLDVALQEGAKNIGYTKLVNFLSSELRTLLNIDEEINVISSPEDSISFIMEVSSFLKELNCTYSALTQGHVSDRLQNPEDRLLLLDYLATELMAARILQEKKPNKKIELKLQETEHAADMRKILMSLRFPRPPANITVQQLFQKICPTVQDTIKKVGKELPGSPAFNGVLSDQQWEILNGVQADLNNEYKIRREMLLTRLDVTIQSFQWSEKTKGKDDLFEKVYAEKRKRLRTEPDVELADLLAVRDEIAIIEKTSSSTVRKNTQSALNKVIIGQVPDRGGRTSEHAPPPPEMPSWQQRTPGPPRGGGRGGGGRGGGNFSQNDYTNRSQNYGKQQSNEPSKYGNQGSYGGNTSSYSGSYTPSRNFDSAGSYSSIFTRDDSYGRMKNRGSSTSDNSSRDGSYGNYGGNKGSFSSDNKSYDNRSFDSAGSFKKEPSYEQNSKRVKTYDSFHSNKTTYADQYVQEEQHNQQHHGRGGSNNGGGRGHSNYNRGGRQN